MDKRRYARVLRDLNELRAQLGLEPITEIPKGDCLDPWTCPIGRVIEARSGFRSVVTDGWYEEPHFNQFSDVLRDFVHDFDAGLFPELISIDEPALS